MATIQADRITINRIATIYTWGPRGPGVQLLEANICAKRFRAEGTGGVLGTIGFIIGTAAAVWEIRVNAGTTLRVGLAHATQLLDSEVAPAYREFAVAEGAVIRFALRNAALVVTFGAARHTLALDGFIGTTMYPWAASGDGYSITISRVLGATLTTNAAGELEIDSANDVKQYTPIRFITGAAGMTLDGKSIRGDGTYLPLAGGTMTGPMSMGGFAITSAALTAPFITGGTIVSPAMGGGTIVSTTISSSNMISTIISGGTMANNTRTGGTLSNAAISNGTITFATLTSCNLASAYIQISTIDSALSISTSGTLTFTGAPVIDYSTATGDADEKLKLNRANALVIRSTAQTIARFNTTTGAHAMVLAAPLDMGTQPIRNVAASTGSFYERILSTVYTLSGAIVNGVVNIAIDITRIGNAVTLGWSDSGAFNGTGVASAIGVNTFLVPIGMRSLSIKRFVLAVRNNGVSQMGLLFIDTAGALSFRGDAAGGDFTGAGPTGIFAGGCSWIGV